MRKQQATRAMYQTTHLMCLGSRLINSWQLIQIALKTVQFFLHILMCFTRIFKLSAPCICLMTLFFKLFIKQIRRDVMITLNLSLGFNDTFDTIRLYKRPCQGCVQTDVLSGNHKTKSVVLFRQLTQTKEAPKKRNRTVKTES